MTVPYLKFQVSGLSDSWTVFEKQKETETDKMVYQVANLADLQSQLDKAGDKLVVIDFFATWCGPCKMIAPKIEEMEQSMKNVVFLKVDVDEAEDAASEYEVSAMPTFILIKKKQKVVDLMGANPDKLTELVTKHAD